MAIYNLGSINADYFYRVPHLPRPGETLAATDLTRGLGGKGANMSVAASRAGADTIHIGAVGADGDWAIARLKDSGINTRFVDLLPDTPTGHAIINIDDQGENAIVLLPGANHAVKQSTLAAALKQASKGDTLLIQNETTLQVDAAKLGRDQGLYIAYAAAPFDAEATAAILPFIDFLILNEVESDQLVQATGKSLSALGIADVVVTLGARGSQWLHAGRSHAFPAIPVTPVDTTGAGDTFTGYVLAARDCGMSMDEAMNLATRAGALMVTRHGTSDVIPTLDETTSDF